MKIESIQLYNWISIYGKTPELKLSTDKDKPLTIFYAANGTGKTAVLHGLHWLFTGSTLNETKDDYAIYANRDALNEADDGEHVTAKVSCKFSHDYKKYQLSREVRYTKSSDLVDSEDKWSWIPKTAASMFCGPLKMQCKSDGRSEWNSLSEEDANNISSSIFPTSISEFFMFQGEKLEDRFSDKKDSQAAKLKKQMRSFFGITAVQDAVEAIRESKKKFQDVAAKLGKNSNVAKAAEELTCLNEEYERIANDLSDCNRHKDLLEQENDNYNEKLKKSAQSALLTKQKDQLVAQKNQLQKDLEIATIEINDLYEKDMYQIFLIDKFNVFLTSIQERRTQVAPSKELLESILKHQICICGCGLKEEATHIINELLNNSVKATKSGRTLQELSINAERFVETDYPKIEKSWKSASERQRACENNLAKIKTKLDDLNADIKSIVDVEIKKLTRAIDKNEKTIELEIERATKYRLLLSRIKDEQIAAEKKLEKTTSNSDKDRAIQSKLALINHVSDLCDEIYTYRDKSVREDLEEYMQTSFAEISATTYSPKINDDYLLSLTLGLHSKQRPDQSTGETKLLGYSFIGSILQLHKENNENSEYPLLIDAPFAGLASKGTDYKQQAAKYLLNVAGQLVFFLTNDDWAGDVKEYLEPYIGKHYAMINHTDNIQGHTDTELSIAKINIDLCLNTDKGFKYASIQEVSLN